MGDRDLSHASTGELSRIWPSPESEALLRRKELADILRYYLRRPMASLLGAAGSAASSGGGDAAAALTTPLDVLLSRDPRPPIGLLRQLKDWAKENASGGGEAAVPKSVARVLYFAAIATAFCRCGQRITELSDLSVRKGMEWSLQQPFVAEVGLCVLSEALALLGPPAPAEA